MKTEKINKFIFVILLLSIVALFLEHGFYSHPQIHQIIVILDLSILLLFLIDIIFHYISAENKKGFLKTSLLDLIILFILLSLFIYNRYISFLLNNQNLRELSKNIIILRNVLILLKLFARIKKLNYFLKKIANHPAQTIIFSFVIIILLGTLLLMMPFSTADNSRLGIINSLFTATSAVCVTGLIVVDTATKFSIYGQIIILSLIQIGGLGIMILSFFSIFLIRQKVSLEDKLLISYMLNEQDMKNISKSIANIIFITFIIELIGAGLLLLVFKNSFGFNLKAVFFSVFHSISAFCNAGFALFSDSFEQYKSNSLLNFTIAGLIILGGLSFIVINNLIKYFKSLFVKKVLKQPSLLIKINLNTKAVLIITFSLILSGAFLIYAFEHKTNLLSYNLKTEYLASFFQSVTLRTAGFNTINFAHLNLHTYLLMIMFMFIGAASGSTAGGIKVNTLSVIFAYIRSLYKGQDNVILFKHSISKDVVNKAFLIILLFITSIFTGVILLSITEKFLFRNILFETVSALGTVGLSTGITSQLTYYGKIIIILLMFIGRLGPLTLVSALSLKAKQAEIKYPSGNINIG